MKLSEMFPNRFLRGQDMTNPLLIVIRGVELVKVRAGAGKPEEAKWVLRFDLAKSDKNPKELPGTQRPPEGYGLVLRKTLANEISLALSTDDSDKWIAGKVVIFPLTENVMKRDVIAIHARAPKHTAEQPAPEPTQEAS